MTCTLFLSSKRIPWSMGEDTRATLASVGRRDYPRTYVQLARRPACKKTNKFVIRRDHNRMGYRALLFAALATYQRSNAFSPSFRNLRQNARRHENSRDWPLRFQEAINNDIENDSPVDSPHYSTDFPRFLQMAPLTVKSPAEVEFVESQELQQETPQSLDGLLKSATNYPFAMMLSGSAPYIAAHAGETIVFHMPGDYFEESDSCNALLSDIALARVLGMKIVIVIGCRYDLDSCDLDFTSNAHECYNSLKVTDAKTLRSLEEEVGFMRTELERKLNRYIRVHGSGTIGDGNVIGGNFYTARQFGRINDVNFEHTGYAPSGQVHATNIKHHLDNDDVVLLTTVGLSSFGDLVSVNGYHLTASVAAALDAYKIVYLANEGSVLKAKHGDPVQEIPLSFVNEVVDFHEVQVHKSGYATFQKAASTLDSHAVELLLHLGWASWALENGVTRAHIVNPGDGAILEELFTSKNGVNTCLYHDRESETLARTNEGDLLEEEFQDFFGAQ